MDPRCPPSQQTPYSVILYLMPAYSNLKQQTRIQRSDRAGIGWASDEWHGGVPMDLILSRAQSTGNRREQFMGFLLLGFQKRGDCKQFFLMLDFFPSNGEGCS